MRVGVGHEALVESGAGAGAAFDIPSRAENWTGSDLPGADPVVHEPAGVLGRAGPGRPG
jgi:hypothetical protein